MSGTATEANLLGTVRTSSTTKLPPSSPQRTTWEYEGSSSILGRISTLRVWLVCLYHIVGRGILVEFPDLRKCEPIVITGPSSDAKTHEITGAVGNTSAGHAGIPIHTLIEAHWIDFSDVNLDVECRDGGSAPGRPLRDETSGTFRLESLAYRGRRGKGNRE